MATTPPTRVTDLTRRFRLDVDTATYPTVQYQQLLGIVTMKLMEDLRSVDDETYDDSGAMREEVTGYAWRIEGKFKSSKNLAGTSRDAVQAFLRTKFDALKAADASAAANEFGIRFYDREGMSGEAYEGRVYVKVWNPNDDKGASDEITFTLFGQGALTAITNPAASQVPVVTSVEPFTAGTLAAAGGDAVHIYGNHFTGASDVEFNDVDATEYNVIDDSHIVAVSPANSAGTYAVDVTNASGTGTLADAVTYA